MGDPAVRDRGAVPLRRPRVKPEHRPYLTVDGHVRIGSVIHGIGAEIEDPDGWVWALVQALDGTRTPTRTAGEIAAAHPELTAADVLRAMADLAEAGFLEDAAATVPEAFTERETERYGRGVALLRWMDRSPRADSWELQLRLAKARVLLIGLGGAGGIAAQGLVASGVGRLHCVDPDVVELSNLNRQLLYREQDIGRPKVDAALESLRALNTDVEVTGARQEIRGPEDLERLLRRTPAQEQDAAHDLLVLSADRPAALRRWANRACLATRTPWVEGGYRGPHITVGVYVPGRGACFECHRDQDAAARDLRLAPGQDEESVSPRMEWGPVNAATATLSAGLLVHAAISALTGVPPVEPGYRHGINLMTPGEPDLNRYPRRDTCPACAGLAP
ncbi:ThiF family adenylyltransferase [Streptomyces sp. NPDC050803]|uniref:HesA/MoeB/ThiF family protein n=1 Tax=unclassified Streptomyces TaxID=2593676 RepID=UPI00341DC824